MPNCFQLRKKGEKEPSTFQDIDEEICKHLGVTPDPVKYHCGWYDLIGWRLAIGNEFPAIIKEFKGEPEDPYYVKLTKIAEWLNEHYTSSAWAERW